MSVPVPGGTRCSPTGTVQMPLPCRRPALRSRAALPTSPCPVNGSVAVLQQSPTRWLPQPSANPSSIAIPFAPALEALPPSPPNPLLTPTMGQAVRTEHPPLAQRTCSSGAAGATAPAVGRAVGSVPRRGAPGWWGRGENRRSPPKAATSERGRDGRADKRGLKSETVGWLLPI